MNGGQIAFHGIEIAWSSRSHVGLRRELNEDRALAQPPFFAVADGMGGHDAGDVASSVTVDRLSRLSNESFSDVDSVAAVLGAVNSDLFFRGGPETTVGTTLVGAILVEYKGLPAWLIVNVGDSRAYSSVGGEVTQLTKDHSYVQELVDAGELDPWQARSHPNKNVVTRALGAEPTVVPDFWVRPVRPGERILLCSDGLTGEVEDGVIAAVLSAEIGLAEVTENLVDLALKGGGRDNVSVVVVEVLATSDWDGPTTETRPKRTGTVAGTAVLEPPATGQVPAVPHSTSPLIDELPDFVLPVPDVGEDPVVRRRLYSQDASGLIDSVPGAASTPAPAPSEPEVRKSSGLIEAIPSDLAGEQSERLTSDDES